MLYNAPRAASIKAKTKCLLFALNRECFNNIVKEAAVKKRAMYEEFLSKVDLLQSIEPYEKLTLADAIKIKEFEVGQVVIT